MFVGYVDSIRHDHVEGWALDTDFPSQAVEILIFIDGHLRATVVCDELRGDLAALGSYGDGRHGFRYRLPVPLPNDREHRVVVTFKSDGCPLSNGHKLLTAAGPQEFQPILVTAPGRSGTTLFMSRLGQSRDICIADLPPFELRMISYYAAAYRVLTAKADPARSTNPDDIEGNGLFIGFNPFFDGNFEPAFSTRERFLQAFAGMIPNTLSDSFRRIVEAFYRSLSDDQGKGICRYFAEKTNNIEPNVRMFARLAFGSIKEFVLVRDPRDVYCSHLSYFHTEPERSFGEVTTACTSLLAIQREARTDTMFVSYEALVLRPDEMADRVSAFLGVDRAMGDRTRESAIFNEHATSQSPGSSIGRWQRDLAEDARQRCNEAWAEFLETFGYHKAEPGQPVAASV